jgi:Holliday junction resolvase RusA-like endonuclease
MTEFFMPMIPPTVTAQEHKTTRRNGKTVIYDPPEIKDAKSKLTASLAAHRPETPFCSGVRLVVKWLFPVCGKHRNGEYRTSQPDTDNLQKMLKDCMTKCGFWKDDALVASEICEKFWSDIPGIWIHIEELENGAETGQV